MYKWVIVYFNIQSFRKGLCGGELHSLHGLPTAFRTLTSSLAVVLGSALNLAVHHHLRQFLLLRLSEYLNIITVLFLVKH